jgi:hypothetical protein
MIVNLSRREFTAISILLKDLVPVAITLYLRIFEESAIFQRFDAASIPKNRVTHAFEVSTSKRHIFCSVENCLYKVILTEYLIQ